MLDKLLALPIWARWIAAVLAIASLDAIHMAWGERQIAVGFSESLIAVLLYWSTLIGAFAVAIWAGGQAGRRTTKTWLGWIVGIVVLLASFELRDFTKDIPGVGWRIKAMEQAREEALLYDDN